jgi:hypothetical protein
MEYPQLLVVPENKHRSQRARTDVSILYHIMGVNCGLHMVSNGRPDTCSSTRRDMEDPGTFGINSRICKTTASIGRRTVPTTMTCLGCTTCISICKFLKSIKFMYFNWYMNFICLGVHLCSWKCRVWMIHFWMVENHYPDRVMRQFGLFQQVPPPAPIDYQ